MRKLALLLTFAFALPGFARTPPASRKKGKKPAPPAAVEPAPPPAAEPRSADAGEPPPDAESAAPAAREPPAAPTPAPAAETPPARAAASDRDLDKLRAEYTELRDALFRSRARAATLQGAMFTTKLVVGLRWRAARHYIVRRARVLLDEAQLWDAGDRSLGDDRVKVAEASVAPGHHELAIRLDVRAKDNDKLGYVSEHTFALDVPESKVTQVEIVGDEDGDLPEYKPELRIELKSEK